MTNNKNLKDENKKILKSLNCEYAKEYKKIKSMLSEDIKSKEQIDEILSDILILLFDAQEEQRDPKDIYEGDFDGFYRNLLDALSSNVVTSEEKLKSKTRKNILIGFLSFIIVVLVVVGVCWQNGAISVWQEGMAFFEKDSSYIVSSRELYNLDVEMKVNLNDLDSNTGKVVYDDGQCKIEIKSVDFENGDYKIYFKSYGQYDRKGGILISPISHIDYSVDQDIFIQTKINQDLTYVGNVYFSGSLFKDGDEYAFTILSSNQLDQNAKDAIEENDGQVEVKLSNLKKYTWNRGSDTNDEIDGCITLNNIKSKYDEKLFKVLNEDVKYKVLEFSLRTDNNKNIDSLHFVICEDNSSGNCYEVVYNDEKTDIHKMDDDFLKDYDEVELKQKNIYLNQFLEIFEDANFKEYDNADVYTYTYNKFDDNLINYDEVYEIDKNNNLKESSKSNKQNLHYIKCIAERQDNQSTVKRVIYLIAKR